MALIAIEEEADWYYRIVDQEGEPETFSSLAFTSDGFPRVSYYHASNHDTMYVAIGVIPEPVY